MPFDTPESATPRDRRNIRRNTWLLVAWVVSMEATLQVSRRDLLPEGAASWLAATLPALLGGLVIWSYMRFVREADELQRTIQLNALAVSFGATIVVAILAYPALQIVGAPDMAPKWFAALGIFLYLGGVSHGTWRYR
jgi:hypothetical protein